MKKLGLVFMLTLLFAACKQDEKVINSFDDENKVLMSVVEANGTSIKLADLFNNKIITEDVVDAANGFKISDTISKIISFREHIFLLSPSTYKIYVLNYNDFKMVDTVDFLDEMLEPTDICFANATDAYIAHGNSNKLTLLDLTNLKPALQITVGNHPIALAASGNQIYVANYTDNNVSVVDSRTNREEAKIQTGVGPKFVGIRSNGKECVVVAEGAGKNGTEPLKSEAICTIIDVATRNILANTAIGFGTISALEAIPQSLAISDKDYAFIPTETNLLKINLRTRTSVSNVGKYKYSYIVNNSYRQEVVMIMEDESGVPTKAIVAGNSTAKKNYEMEIPSGTRWILPIY